MRLTLLAVATALTLTSPVVAQTFTKEEIKQLALEAILENPQIVMDAVDLLRAQEAEAKATAQVQAFQDNKDLLIQDANAPVLGNPDGDITIVEFFDYNCGYCKRAMTAMQAVMANDPNVRVVFREFPILSEGSAYASRAALASRAQGKYEEFHWALMSANGLDEGSVMRIAAQIGLDVDQLRTDMDAPEVAEHIATTRDVANALQFTGTPAFIIGDEIVGGYIPEESMVDIIKQQRGG